MIKSMTMLRAYLRFDDADSAITIWMREHGPTFLRISLGIIFVWFGALKIIGNSPVTVMVARTVYWADPSWFVPFLGWWEIIIGICFLIRPLVRIGILLLIPQMVGTFLPLILLPNVTFQGSILYPTLEGHYIIKNIIIISAAIVIGSHVRDPHISDLELDKISKARADSANPSASASPKAR
jgi:uncharacterized membrane protein YkgB